MRTTLFLVLLSACTADPLVTTATARIVQQQEHLLCDVNICLLVRALDRDGDGVGDADELALGTDPERPRSRPELPDLVRALADRRLPSFEDGHAVLVSLPSVGPDGQSVFGGDAMLPARRSLLESFGIGVPAREGIDLSLGFTLTTSLDGLAFDFQPLKWAVPVRPGPDTTMDADGGTSVVGAVLEGRQINDLEVQLSERSGSYAFGEFTFRDQSGDQWSVNTQTSPGYSHASGEMVQSQEPFSPERLERKIDVTEHKDAEQSVRVVVTTETTTSRTGEESTTVVTETTTSAPDGSSSFYESETVIDGESRGRSTQECSDGLCSEKIYPSNGTPAGETTDEGDATAHHDPDHVEYQPSPEVIDAILAMRAGPIRTVPFDGNGNSLEFSPVPDRHNTGLIALYTPETAEISTDPTFIHLPRGGDYDPNVETEAPTADPDTRNGQCLYCNQGGD